jgi:hypothetical protein
VQAWLRHNRLLAGSLAAWTATAVVFGFAVSALPEGVCDYDNHDAYVEASQGGYILLGGLPLAGLATIGLIASAARADRGRKKIALVLGSVLSLALTAFLALITLVALIAFSCLE